MQYLHRKARDGSEWLSVIFLYLIFTWILCLIPSVCVWSVCLWLQVYVCVCMCACIWERKRERAREQKWFLFCFLGKTCKVAILTEVLLLGMDVLLLGMGCLLHSVFSLENQLHWTWFASPNGGITSCFCIIHCHSLGGQKQNQFLVCLLYDTIF